MPTPVGRITPKRSVALFALLSIAAIAASYLALLLVATAGVVIPFWLLTNASSLQMQIFLLLLGGLAVAATILWSLFPRPEKFVPPGPLIDRAAQPRLFSAIDEIASALNEKTPSEVYLLNEPNAFVAEPGGFLGFGARRILGIGFPLFSLLTVSEFRAVLTHEFAHYYSGDTSLAPWVYRAQMTQVRTFENVAEISRFGRIAIVQALTIAATFLVKGILLAFLHVIRYVSRIQEFRSDELACFIAGKLPAMRGLEKIEGSGVFWQFYWRSEVVPILESGRIPDIGQGFRLFLSAPSISPIVDATVASVRNSREADRFDTHPPLSARIDAMDSLDIPHLPTDDRLAATLLDRSDLTFFVQALNPGLAAGALRSVAWDDIAIEVTIPHWRAEISKFGHLFLGKTAVAPPELVAQLPQVGQHLPDPKGTLLTREQRTVRASYLLGMALGLMLVEKGWRLETRPGFLLLRLGDATFSPSDTLEQIENGQLTRGDWIKRCQELGISDLTIGLVSGNPQGSQQIRND